MRDKDLFDVIESEIEGVRLARASNEKIYGSSTLSTKELLLRNDVRLMGKLEALEDLRTKLVSKGYFIDG